MCIRRANPRFPWQPVISFPVLAGYDVVFRLLC